MGTLAKCSRKVHGRTAWTKRSVKPFENLVFLVRKYLSLVSNIEKKRSCPIKAKLTFAAKFWPHFAAPENVEICLDLVLKGMGLGYIDLWLVHWPYAAKPTSRAALLVAAGGPTKSDDEKGIADEDGKPVIDWEHTSARIAKAVGKWEFRERGLFLQSTDKECREAR